MNDQAWLQNISQMYLIAKIAWGFNNYFKSLITFNTPAAPRKFILCKQKNRYRNIKIYTEEIPYWCSIATIPCKSLTTTIIRCSTWAAKVHVWIKHEYLQGTYTCNQGRNQHEILLLTDETISKPQWKMGNTCI